MTELITSPFGAFTTAREVLDGHDLTGRTAIVTGGATGIGLETARALSEAGCDVVLAVRTQALGEQAARRINETANGPAARVEILDLADLSTVRSFGDRWGSKPLHLLINNAGVMACPLAYTADDLEMQIGTNHFGHCLLALLLAPALEAGSKSGQRSRVVSLSSIGHFRSPVMFEDLHFRRRPYDKWSAYGQSKTANALFAVAYHHCFNDRGVSANAVMPGGIMTPLQRHLAKEEMIAFGWIDDFGKVADGFKTPEQGASTSIWAAVGAELEGIGGLYLENCAEAAPFDPEKPRVGVKPYAIDPAAADRLWTSSITLLDYDAASL